MNKLIPLLGLLAAFPPLSTDMYLPAIPSLQAQWDVSLATANLTLVAFFLSFSFSLLFYGPLSDRFGRRPLLMAGIGVFVGSSLLCAASHGAGQMTGFRVFQGAGAASGSALSMAIARDAFDSRDRERILAHIGVIIALAPMIAPVLGGVMLQWLSWRWIFIVQAVLGGVSFWGVHRIREPLKERNQVPILKMAGRYLRLFRNRRYLSLNLMMAFGIWPLFSFIGGSADIYIRRFGLSEQVYSYFFAFNAAALMAGFYACGRLLKRFPSMTLLLGGFAGVLLGGLAMAGLTGDTPWRMALPMAFISICLGVSRPLSLSLVLDQVETDVGAASSLMMFTYFSIGSLAMWAISQPWGDKIGVLATTSAASALMVLITLILFRRVGMRRPAVQPVGRAKP